MQGLSHSLSTGTIPQPSPARRSSMASLAATRRGSVAVFPSAGEAPQRRGSMGGGILVTSRPRSNSFAALGSPIASSSSLYDRIVERSPSRTNLRVSMMEPEPRDRRPSSPAAAYLSK